MQLDSIAKIATRNRCKCSSNISNLNFCQTCFVQLFHCKSSTFNVADMTRHPFLECPRPNEASHLQESSITLCRAYQHCWDIRPCWLANASNYTKTISFSSLGLRIAFADWLLSPLANNDTLGSMTFDLWPLYNNVMCVYDTTISGPVYVCIDIS